MYQTRKTSRQCSIVTYNPGNALDFDLDYPPYDAECRDQIASVSFDLEKEIQTFCKAGYTDDEILAVYESCRQASRIARGRVGVRLPKPVRVSLTVSTL